MTPPKVASAHAAKNRTKNPAPSARRARFETGLRGSSGYWNLRLIISADFGSFSITRFDFSTRIAKSTNGLCSLA